VLLGLTNLPLDPTQLDLRKLPVRLMHGCNVQLQHHIQHWMKAKAAILNCAFGCNDHKMVGVDAFCSSRGCTSSTPRGCFLSGEKKSSFRRFDQHCSDGARLMFRTFFETSPHQIKIICATQHDASIFSFISRHFGDLLSQMPSSCLALPMAGDKGMDRIAGISRTASRARETSTHPTRGMPKPQGVHCFDVKFQQLPSGRWLASPNAVPTASRFQDTREHSYLQFHGIYLRASPYANCSSDVHPNSLNHSLTHSISSEDG
jgi:hypothetical protein